MGQLTYLHSPGRSWLFMNRILGTSGILGDARDVCHARDGHSHYFNGRTTGELSCFYSIMQIWKSPTGRDGRQNGRHGDIIHFDTGQTQFPFRQNANLAISCYRDASVSQLLMHILSVLCLGLPISFRSMPRWSASSSLIGLLDTWQLIDISRLAVEQRSIFCLLRRSQRSQAYGVSRTAIFTSLGSLLSNEKKLTPKVVGKFSSWKSWWSSKQKLVKL